LHLTDRKLHLDLANPQVWGFKRPLQLFTALTIEITARKIYAIAPIFLLKNRFALIGKFPFWSIYLLGRFKIVEDDFKSVVTP
jgi:hypothetical protein